MNTRRFRASKGHQRRRGSFALCIAALASITLGTKPAAASTTPSLVLGAQTVTRTVALDTTSCQALIDSLASNPAVSATVRNQVSKVPATGCAFHSTVSKGASQPAPASNAGSITSAGVWCNNVYVSGGYSVGGTWVATAHVNVGMCFNGSAAWKVWGADCPIDTTPVMGSTLTWCDVWQNGSWHTEPGANFNLWYYWSPWWVTSHYLRVSVYGNGYVSGAWGS